MMRGMIAGVAWLAASPLVAQGAVPVPPAPEDRYWHVETLPVPDDAVLEVGGMDFLSDGRLVVSTRRGQVWIVDGALADDLQNVRVRLFADGLFEGLGLKVMPDDRIFVLERHELSELIDEDGDGRCDHVRIVADSWGLTGNYHEFAFGLPADRDGNLYVALGLGFFDPRPYLGRSRAPYRGWVMRVSPDGTVTPWASGFRSPNGISLSPEGDLLVTDNQGDWVPACPVHVVERGRHYGHPASLDWRPEYRDAGRKANEYRPATDVPRERAAVWLPYDLSRSTGNLAWDTSGGRFGPFAGQPFAADVADGLVLRMSLERVRGSLQGAAFAFRPGVGAVNRVAFAGDGTLLCGLTSRGWGGEDAAHGITRVRWTGETPMEMRTVSLRQDGFDVELTRPLAAGVEVLPEQVRASQYRYRYWWKYGSPEVDQRPLTVRSVAASADRRRLTITLDDLRPGFVTRVELDGVVGEGDHPLLHPRFDYTLNELPDGPPAAERISEVVPAPKTREQLAAYAVFLSDLSHTMETWNGDGWTLGSDPALDRSDPSRLTVGDGPSCMFRPDGSEAPLRSIYAFGDCTVRGKVMLADGGGFGLLLPNGDVVDVPLGDADPGTWLAFEADYRAPSAGAPARLVFLTLDGEERVSDRRLGGRGARGPIGLVDARGASAAFENVLVVPGDLAIRDDGSFRDDGPWKPGLGDWTFEDGALRSTSGLSSVVRQARGEGDVAFEADLRLSPGMRAAIRVLANELGVGGHEVRLNRSAPDARKTGSLVGAVTVRHSLVAYDDTWFRVRVEVDRRGETDLVRVLVNGVVTAEHEARATEADGDFVSISRLEREGSLEVRNPYLEQAPE